jgi:hypothetical protein
VLTISHRQKLKEVATYLHYPNQQLILAYLLKNPRDTSDVVKRALDCIVHRRRTEPYDYDVREFFWRYGLKVPQ